jgi:hypothetical protein
MAGFTFSRLSISYTKYIFWSGKMEVARPGGAKIEAHFDPDMVSTDQPSAGGEGSKPTAFELFLVSIGICAGIFVLTFAANTASQHTAFLLFNEFIPMS